MALLRLRAIYPNWLRIVNRDHELDRSRPGAQWLKAREEAISERCAGSLEAALHDGVVLGEVAEGEGVAGVGGDDVGVEGELGACTDSDGDVGGKGEGEEGAESKREGGVHDVVIDVVVLACFELITSAFADWQGAKSDETQGNSS